MFTVVELPNRSISWLCKNRDKIDSDPIYQRPGHVWPGKAKALLIDSILNEYDVPKIYLADFTRTESPLNTKRKEYAVIDGKQRLEAVYDFFSDRLTLNDDFQYAKDPSLQLGGLKLSDLKMRVPKLARRFTDYNLAIMGVITDEEGKINEMFIRLNRSKPLSGAEIRNAMAGVVPKLIRKIAAHKFFKTKIKFAVNRYQDRNAAAKLLLLEFRGKFVDTKRFQLDRFVAEGVQSQSRTGFAAAAKQCTVVLNEMLEVFADRDPLLRSQGPLTLYYWFVRTQPSERRPLVRDFLLLFEKSRSDNRERANMKPRPPDIDNELLSFDFASRSPNDQASLVQMFAILQSRFESFLKVPKQDAALQ